MEAIHYYDVGIMRLPEYIIQGVEFQEGTAIVWYDYDGESRQCKTGDSIELADLRTLVDSRPELERKAEMPVVKVVESRISPQVALPVQSDAYAVYFNEIESHDSTARTICTTLESAINLVNNVVLNPDYHMHAWKGTIYPLTSEPQIGSPYGKSDLARCLYQQRK